MVSDMFFSLWSNNFPEQVSFARSRMRFSAREGGKRKADILLLLRRDDFFSRCQIILFLLILKVEK